MSEDLKKALGLPSVNQVGFVVKDLDKTIEHYEPLFGSYETMDVDDMEWEYRGRPEKSSIRLALFMDGDVEIEFIQWISGKTPHKDFLDSGGEGVQHLRFLVDNVEEKVEEAKDFGYQPVWYKRFHDDLACAYVEQEGNPLMIEFYENREN